VRRTGLAVPHTARLTRPGAAVRTGGPERNEPGRHRSALLASVRGRRRAGRIYRDGDLIGTSDSPHFQDEDAHARRTYHYAVGFLSARVDLRFTVGLGLVDEAGALIRDTVPPPAVAAIRARATRIAVILSWRGVSDPGGLRGYRVQRNGVRYALVLRMSVTIPRRRASARWTIRAIDRAGNLGPPTLIIVR
jgi:hypothetical protein